MTDSAPEMHPRGDDGFAGGAEGLLFGMLVFVVGALLIANAWTVVDTKMALDVASRQAARSYVEASDGSSATISARLAVDEALSGFGRDPSRGSVKFVGGSFGRCERVTVVVSYRAPVVALPLFGELGGAETVSAQHSELVDPYRTGLPGEAQCG